MRQHMETGCYKKHMLILALHCGMARLWPE